MKTEEVEKCMNIVINILNYHIKNEILDIFNMIQRSKLHKGILNIAKTNTNTCVESFAELKFYEEYYEYMKELESIIREYNE